MNLMEVPRGRVWKGSKISPFGGNTALVLYKCARSGHSGSTRNNHWKYFVQVLHNEMAVVVPVRYDMTLCRSVLAILISWTLLRVN